MELKDKLVTGEGLQLVYQTILSKIKQTEVKIDEEFDPTSDNPASSKAVSEAFETLRTDIAELFIEQTTEIEDKLPVWTFVDEEEPEEEEEENPDEETETE